ncbi:hypothetical protein MXM82_23735 [Pseudomonas asiatica]|uniref:hypothetical protein n=1 Tax=Pseudomonas asiatica TaxID=2219225 RepID=UPI002DB956DF|nr:hypothetical protein [Pseudomonas asiatica]MEB6592117.1 hypothetical protein [Pseudomonas asiatica]
MNEVTCIVFICDGIGPTALVAQRNGQGGYLGFLDPRCRRSGSTRRDQECVVRKGVTGKTRRTVYPCERAGVNALHRFLGKKRSDPVVQALKGGVIGVHGASICCFVSQALWTGFLHTAMAAITPWGGGLGKIGRSQAGGFGTRASARFFYKIGSILKSGLKSATFVQISLHGGSGTCQSSEKFFFFNILGPLCGPKFSHA